MHRSLAVLSLGILAAACADQPTAVAPEASSPAFASVSGSGKYIIVLNEGANPRSVAAIAGVDPSHVYTAALNGFAAELNHGQLNALRNNPNVAYVEPDAEVRLFATQTVLYSWGIDRVDQANLPLSTTFTYNSTGAGVSIYVLDTGIRLTHLDYAGRANYIPNGANGDFVGDGHGSASDCQGHGSHVAGTAAGTYSGIAKGATIYAGRVVNCQGGGNTSMVIAGMDWVAQNGNLPGVVNMSLGYGNVQSVRTAAANLSDAGFVVVAAAGNGNWAGRPIDACSEAPAGEPKVFTVGSTTSTDAESSFSNYGTCVDILAPGSSITSSSHTTDNGLVTMSGTSMASPHVAGVAAQYLALNPSATPAQVRNAMVAAAGVNKISLHRSSSRNGTPNRLLFSNY
jgi:subtilisin family serine protease